MKFAIYPYNLGSESAKALAGALDCKRLKHEGPARKLDLLINWGSSQIKRAVKAGITLNKPEAVSLAANKLSTFLKLAETDVNIPEFTEKADIANGWLKQGVDVVERHTLTGHSGEGVVIVEHDEEGATVNGKAKLYVKYIPKKQEFRLHVFQGNVFFVQRKARDKDVPDDQVNWQVRNHANGFVFAFQNVDVPQAAKDQAVQAIAALGLDFGAVDMIWNERQNKYYVLEINTACGMEGTTLDKYVEQFKRVMEEM